MVKLSDILTPSFKSLRHEVSVDLVMPTMTMVHVCRSNDFDFFHPWLESGCLTIEQMKHACECYCLGKTKSGLPIFWMIDDMNIPHDAHIPQDKWLSSLLKGREPLLSSWRVRHCLFGLHLLTEKNVCVVESEQSAVVLSELFPESIWMAYATTAHLSPDLFAPLQNRTVTIYPRTDSMMNTYLFFHDFASLICKRYPSITLRIDSTLENHATASQKERCIDILDFIQNT